MGGHGRHRADRARRSRRCGARSRARRSRSACWAATCPLRDEPAVAPLLDAMRVCVGAVPLDASAAARLGVLAARRPGRRRAAARAPGAARARARRRAAGAPATCCSSRRWAATTPVTLPLAARPVRPARPGARRRPARPPRVPDADAQTVLWALWDAADQAEAWRRSALAGGAAGERADRDLDAVLALFRAAETFVDRMPRSTPGAFVDWLQAQDLPSDSLAARARRAAVQVLTPAGAAGREWEVVVVAGCRTARGPTCGCATRCWARRRSWTSSRGAPGPAPTRAARPPRRAQAVLADELRTFAVACSRARTSLLVTAVDDVDHQPSLFVELVDPAERRGRRPAADQRARPAGPARAGRPAAGAPRAVGRSTASSRTPRRRGPSPGSPPPASPGADPAQWLRPRRRRRATRPLWAADERVPVSPSKVETAQRCALRWALEAAGRHGVGQRRRRTSARCCTRSRRSTRAAPRRSCPPRSTAAGASSGLGTGWPAMATRRRGGRDGAPARRLPALRGRAAAGRGRVLARDRPGDPARQRRPDRARRTTAPVRVVDLKTGASPPSVAKAAENPQLGAYQLAVDAGAFAGPARRGDRAAARSWSTWARAPRPPLRVAAGRSVPRPTGPAGRASWSTRWRTRWPRPRSRRRRTTSATGARSVARARCAARAGRWSHDEPTTAADVPLSAAQIAELVGQPAPDRRSSAAIIEAPLGPSLVVAGAGSGKTETMAARVVWLLANGVVAARPGAGPDVHAQGRGRAGRAGAPAAADARRARPRRRASRSRQRRAGARRRARRAWPGRRSRPTTPTPPRSSPTTPCGSVSTRRPGCSARPPSGSWPATWSRRGATTSTRTRRRRR